MPSASPPPPIGISTVSDLGLLFEQLEPDRALARDDELVLVRMDERAAGLLDVGKRGVERILEERAAHLRLGSVVLARLDLRHRRRVRNEDRARCRPSSRAAHATAWP